MALTRFHYYRRYVPVCDAWIVMAEDEETGVFWIPIRPVCKAIRLDSPSQIEVIKHSWRLAPALQLVPIPTEQRADGTWVKAQQTQCLPWREFSWWMMIADPREASADKREKLLIRQRAVMDVAETVMRKSDDEVAGWRPATAGEVHTRCPVCHTPLCLVIAEAHIVPGVEVE